MFRLATNLCHPEEVSLHDGRRVVCDRCRVELFPDVNDYLASLQPYTSCMAARMYASTTGDLNVRCRLGVTNLDGVLPTEASVKYDTLVQVVHILGMMNSAFLTYEDPRSFDRNSSLNYKIMTSFVSKLEDGIASVGGSELKDYEQDMLGVVHNLMDYLKRMASEYHSNIIDMFLDVYVPYVKRLAPMSDSRPPGSHVEMECVGMAFDAICVDSERIRRDVGKYSMHLDLVYMLVHVYLFCDSNRNLELALNLVLEFISRLCNGRYDERHEVHDRCETHLHHRIRKEHNSRHLTMLLSQMKRPGSCVEYLDLDSAKLIEDMKTMATVRFQNHVWTWSDPQSVVNYAHSQMLPYVMFAPGDPQYYGYILSLSFLLRHRDKKWNTLPKHTLANAKDMVRFVQTYFNKVREFGPTCWTLDTFRLFIASDADFLESVKKFTSSFLHRDMATNITGGDRGDECDVHMTE